jgi:hypothetical protein
MIKVHVTLAPKSAAVMSFDWRLAQTKWPDVVIIKESPLMN